MKGAVMTIVFIVVLPHIVVYMGTYTIVYVRNPVIIIHDHDTTVIYDGAAAAIL